MSHSGPLEMNPRTASFETTVLGLQLYTITEYTRRNTKVTRLS